MSDERDTSEQVDDLDVTASDADSVKGGRKAGKGQQEFLQVKLEDILVSSYN